MEKRISRLIKMGLHLTESGMPLIIKNDMAGTVSSSQLTEVAEDHKDGPIFPTSAPFTLLQLTLNFPPMLPQVRARD